MPPSQIEKHNQLCRLAQAAGIDLTELPGSSCANEVRKPLLISRKDRDEASRLILEAAQQERSLSIFHRHAGLRLQQHKYGHVEKALSNHVLAAGSASVAQALLECLQWAKKGDQKARTPHTIVLPSGLLRFATKVRKTELVRVLAPYASSKELDTALGAATAISDGTIQSVLLDHGADINSLGDHLTDLIASKDAHMVKKLLKQGKSLEPQVLRACIKSAIEVENVDALGFLLTSPVGASASEQGSGLYWERDTMLSLAVERKQYKAFATLAYHTSCYPLSDSRLYSQVVVCNITEPRMILTMTEVLLCLDVAASCACQFWQSTPSPFTDGLVSLRLLWLLIRHEVSLNSQALRFAAETGQMLIYNKLLMQNEIDGLKAWESVNLFAPELQAIARDNLIGRLIQKRTKGDGWADAALVYATKIRRPEWVRALLNLGASPKHNDGEALRLAVRQQDAAVFKLFMTRPFPDSIMNDLIQSIWQYSKTVRLSFMIALLKRPYSRAVFTPLFDDLLCDRSVSRDHDLIMLLIGSGASCTDKGIIAILEDGHAHMLEHFLEVHKHQVERLRRCTFFRCFVTGDMLFLVGRLPRIECPDLRELCFQMLDVHIRQWFMMARAGPLHEYFDFVQAFEIGPVDSHLVNLFGKYQRYLPLPQQSKITKIIVCSQPASIARAFVATLRLAFDADPSSGVNELQSLTHQVVSTYMPDDAAKASKLASVLSHGNDMTGERESSSACLELHLRSLSTTMNGQEWPTDTTAFLLERSAELDERHYSCLRIAATHEQIETLDRLLSVIPRTQHVGGDLLRPLIRYQKLKSLECLFRRGLQPSLARQAFLHFRDQDLLEMAALLLKSEKLDLKNGLCQCVTGTLLLQDDSFVGGLIRGGYFDVNEEEHFWYHLDPQPFRSDKHKLLATLLQSKPRRTLVQQLLLQATRAGDQYLCRVILKERILNPARHVSALSPAPCSIPATLDEAILHRALLQAVENGNVGMCDLLLDHGASTEYNTSALLKTALESSTGRNLEVLTSILEHTETELRPQVLNECLWRAAVFNRKAVCAWLVSKGASPLTRGYGPLLTAADRGLVEILDLFVRPCHGCQGAIRAAFRSSQSTCLRSSVPERQRIEVARILIDAGMRDPDTLNEALLNIARESNPPVGLVKLLLGSGASLLYRQSQCLIEAWRVSNVWLVKLLCQGQCHLSTAAHCFTQACADYHKVGPRDIDLLEVIAMFLGMGVPQDDLDAELASALQTALAVSKEWNMRLVYLLVNRGAALDPLCPKSLYQACLVGDEVFIRTAMRSGPTRETRLCALDMLFSESSRGPESDVSCLNLLFSHGDVAKSIDCDQLIMMTKRLLVSRQTLTLLHALVAMHRPGEPQDNCFGTMLCSNPHKFRELLQWAIVQSTEEISSACISALIRDIFFEESLSKTASGHLLNLRDVLWAPCPKRLLLLALMYGRPSLVPVMVNLGAAPDVKNEQDKSALCLAIERRYVRAADSLFSAGTRINDGSLHAAACVQDLGMIRRLREHGHTSTCRPASYDGRTVVETFLRHEHLDEERLSATMKALTGGIEKPGMWTTSPSLLWLALSSKTPFAMTIALLDNMPRQKRNVDDLWLWKTKYYSALSWVEHGKCANLGAQLKPRLIEYLRNAGFPRIYYAVDGPQPEDAVGVPQRLLEKENERQRWQAYLDKKCAVCDGKPADCMSIHAALTAACAFIHSWKHEIICTDCVIGHLTAQIFPDGVQNHARGAPRCWAQNCQETLNHAEIQRYLDPRLFQAYDDKLTLQLLHLDSQSARCANTAIKCRGGAWFSKADLEELTFFRCQLCQQLTCLQCNSLYEPSHLSRPCPVGLHKKREEENVQSERIVKKISKECGCGANVQKGEGCDHMTCTRCGREWCYDCLVPYAQIRGGDNSAHLKTCRHYRAVGRRVQ